MSQKQDEKQANLLCIISLACELLPVILTYVFLLLTSTFPELEELLTSDVQETLSNVWGVISILLVIAGIVLIIYVRVKYPWHTFGKILMWLYITLAIVIIVAYIVTMILCYLTCTACMDSCNSCADTCRGCE